jgi:hypothetical protein
MAKDGPQADWSLFVIVLLSAVGAAGISGCAAMKASQQPGKRDLGVLHGGVPRTHVIAELGAPVWSETRDGETVDVFAFKQGYAKSTKAARALVHGAADVATFGLWEVVGIPAETLADGTDVQLEVYYTAAQTVSRVKTIKGDKVVNPPQRFIHRPRTKKRSPSTHVAKRKSSAAADQTADAGDIEATSEDRAR